MNKPKVIIYSVIGFLVLGIFLIIYSKVKGSGDDSDMQINVPVAETNNSFTYQEMMKYREDNDLSDQRRTKINIDEQANGDTLTFKIAGIDSLEALENQEEEMVPIAAEPVQQEVVRQRPKPVKQEAHRNAGASVYSADNIKQAYAEIKNQHESTTGNSNNVMPAQQQQRRRRQGFVDGSGANTNNEISSLNVVTFGDQLIQPGSTIKLRLSQAGHIGTEDLPANTVVYGMVSQGSDRLNVEVSMISVNGNTIPVDFKAYDIADGMPGLKLTQQINDPQKQGMASSAGDEVLASTGIYGLPVIGTLTRGAKELLTRNRGNANGVLVTDNYRLLLR